MNKKTLIEFHYQDILPEEEEERYENKPDVIDLENIESVIHELNSQNPISFLNYLFEYSKDPENCEIFNEYIPQLIEILNQLSYNNNETVKDLSSRVLVNFFSVYPNDPQTAFKQNLYAFFFDLVKNSETMPLFLSVLFVVISRSIAVKRNMISAQIFDIFIPIQPDSIDESLLLIYAKIISSFLSLDTDIDSKIRVDLLDKVKTMILQFPDNEELINECLGTIDRITTDVSFTPSFISSELFTVLLEHYSEFCDQGKIHLLSTFSHCYGCTVPLLQQKTLEMIPFTIFCNELENENPSHELNAIISIINCFRNVSETISIAYENGVILHLLNNISQYDFDSKKLAFRALYIAAQAANIEQFHVFESEEFIEIIKELLDPNDREANHYVSDFVELYIERSDENDAAQVYDFIDEFMLNNEISNNTFYDLPF